MMMENDANLCKTEKQRSSAKAMHEMQCEHGRKRAMLMENYASLRNTEKQDASAKVTHEMQCKQATHQVTELKDIVVLRRLGLPLLLLSHPGIRGLLGVLLLLALCACANKVALGCQQKEIDPRFIPHTYTRAQAHAHAYTHTHTHTHTLHTHTHVHTGRHSKTAKMNTFCGL